jgi:site-specific DNA recombinase
MALSEVRRAVGYVRRSRTRQEASLDDQRKEIRKYAEAHGIILEKFFEDDGISGWKGEKLLGLQQMIKEAQTAGRTWSLVIAWDPSRVGRMEPDEKAHYRWELKKVGVESVYVRESIPDGPMGAVVSALRDVEANSFLPALSQNVIRGQVSVASRGGRPSGGPPYGFDIGHFDASGRMFQRIRYLPDARKEVYLPDGTLVRTLARGECIAKGSHALAKLVKGSSDHVLIVIRIFMLAAQGLGAWKIAATLNEEGVPAPRGPGWGPCSGLWTRSTIDGMLSHPAYMGVGCWNRNSVGKFHKIINRSAVSHKGSGKSVANPKDHWILQENAHEALINRDTFLKVQEHIKNRASDRPAPAYRSGRASKSEYLLSGLLTCGRCHHGLWGSTVKGRPTYLCSGYMTYGQSECTRTAFDRGALEGAVMEILRNRITKILGTKHDALVDLVSELVKNDGGQADAEAQRLRSTLAELNRKVRRALELIDERNRVLINDELANLQQQRTEAENRLAQLETKHPSATPELIATQIINVSKKLQEVMSNGTLFDRKEFIRAYIHRIELDTLNGQGTVWMRPLPVKELHDALSFGEGASWSSNAQKILAGWAENAVFNWESPIRKLIKNFSWNPR